jgi:hypothetical protein
MKAVQGADGLPVVAATMKGDIEEVPHTWAHDRLFNRTKINGKWVRETWNPTPQPTSAPNYVGMTTALHCTAGHYAWLNKPAAGSFPGGPYCEPCPEHIQKSLRLERPTIRSCDETSQATAAPAVAPTENPKPHLSHYALKQAKHERDHRAMLENLRQERQARVRASRAQEQEAEIRREQQLVNKRALEQEASQAKSDDELRALVVEARWHKTRAPTPAYHCPAGKFVLKQDTFAAFMAKHKSDVYHNRSRAQHALDTTLVKLTEARNDLWEEVTADNKSKAKANLEMKTVWPKLTSESERAKLAQASDSASEHLTWDTGMLTRANAAMKKVKLADFAGYSRASVIHAKEQAKANATDHIAVTCTACPKNKYQPRANQATCLTCAAGKVGYLNGCISKDRYLRGVVRAAAGIAALEANGASATNPTRCVLSTCTGEGGGANGYLSKPRIVRDPSEKVQKCAWTEDGGCQCWCTATNTTGGAFEHSFRDSATTACPTAFIPGGSPDRVGAVEKTPFSIVNSNQACCIVGKSVGVFEMIHAINRCARFDAVVGAKQEALCDAGTAEGFLTHPLLVAGCCTEQHDSGRVSCSKEIQRAVLYFNIHVEPGLRRCTSLMELWTGPHSEDCVLAEKALARYAKKLHNAAAKLYKEIPTDPSTGRTRYMTRKVVDILKLESVHQIKGFLHNNGGVPGWALPRGFRGSKGSRQRAGPLSKAEFPTTFMERLAHVVGSVDVIEKSMHTYMMAKQDAETQLLIEQLNGKPANGEQQVEAVIDGMKRHIQKATHDEKQPVSVGLKLLDLLQKNMKNPDLKHLALWQTFSNKLAPWTCKLNAALCPHLKIQTANKAANRTLSQQLTGLWTQAPTSRPTSRPTTKTASNITPTKQPTSTPTTKRFQIKNVVKHHKVTQAPEPPAASKFFTAKELAAMTGVTVEQAEKELAADTAAPLPAVSPYQPPTKPEGTIAGARAEEAAAYRVTQAHMRCASC